MAHEIEEKTILNKTKRRDPWFLDDYTLNPYSACSFNCLYCYIRGSKYGENMAARLSIKRNAVSLLETRLHNLSKKGKFGFIVLASATDPYLQFEKDHKLTRQLLEVILKYRFPVHIITKSDLVIRDFDLLHEIALRAILPDDLSGRLPGTLMTFSFSTLDQKVASIFEPGATPPPTRLATLQKAVKAGFKTGVSMMPLLPYISDTTENLESMFNTFKKAGAHYLFPASITLFGNGNSDSKTLVMRAVKRHFPELLPKYEKFFAHDNQMPSFYQNAFQKKMNELSGKYRLPNRII